MKKMLQNRKNSEDVHEEHKRRHKRQSRQAIFDRHSKQSDAYSISQNSSCNSTFKIEHRSEDSKKKTEKMQVISEESIKVKGTKNRDYDGVSSANKSRHSQASDIRSKDQSKANQFQNRFIGGSADGDSVGPISNQPRSRQAHNIVPKLPQVAFVNEKYDN